MTKRRAHVPTTAAAVVKLLEREDATALEVERAKVGGMLVLAGELGELRRAVDRADVTASRVLESLVKQGSSNADLLARLVGLLAARADPAAC